MQPPPAPKIYHIVHVDRLESMIMDGELWCDVTVRKLNRSGTVIGMSTIKERRLTRLLSSHDGLHVGDCVPFYFCPRSIMLYLIHKQNHVQLTYRGGQDPIVHLEADFHETVEWADCNHRRWAFTLSNASSSYFEDRCERSQLKDVKWDAVKAYQWTNCQEGKQAEFLVEKSFPWKLVQRIGVHSSDISKKVHGILNFANHQPIVNVIKQWYY